jgi:hypothetical protein
MYRRDLRTVPMGERTASLVVALLVVSFCAPAIACTTPVFRWALERWDADPYKIVVFHSGPLTGEAKEAVDLLTEAASDEQAPANLVVRTVDVAEEMSEPVAKLWADQRSAEAPWMVVLYPEGVDRKVVWSGPLDVSAAKRLIDSPARREVVRRLADNHSVVWVFLDGGDAKIDDAAHKRLGEELTRLEKVLVIQPPPEPEEFDPDAMPRPKLDVRFSIVRIPAGAADEELFVAMLRNSEDDILPAYAGQPMAFPVFGRGRALYVLIGAGINSENIAEASGFLMDWCSCTVKAQNQGTDMLVRADWETAIVQMYSTDKELPELAGAGDLQVYQPSPSAQRRGQPAPPATSGPPAASSAGSPGGSPLVGVAYGVGAGVVVLGFGMGAYALLTRRRWGRAP